MRHFLLVAVVTLFSLLPAVSNASCECTCVNGHVRAMCSSTLDVPPVCSPQICPIVPPSVQPIRAPKIRPIGTSECHQAQVLNPNTHQYEWRRVCE